MRKGSHHTLESIKEMRKSLKGKIPWNKGKSGIYSKTTLKKMSDVHKNKIATDDTKRKMSEKRKGMITWMKGKHHTEKTKYKMSQLHKGINNNFFGKKHSEETKRIISEKNKNPSAGTRLKMSESQSKSYAEGKQKRKDTDIELAMENSLNKEGITYEKQKYIKGVGCADFFLPHFNIIIECDGNFWHKRKGMPQRDITRDLKASFNGYKTLRFWGSDILNNPPKCIKTIRLAIERRRY